MILPSRLWQAGRESELVSEPSPLPRERFLPPVGPLEIELGFGKGRYLLGRAAAERDRAFVGVEVASRYYRLVRDRAAARGLDNVTLLRGEAVFLMATTLEPRQAEAVHVYHPDPWPKDRHSKRRLFDPETVDLVLGLLAPGGRLFFATDHVDYGAAVAELLAAHPAVDTRSVAGWPGGPRTNYEAKFVARGEPIVRLIATRTPDGDEMLHPRGRSGVLAAPRPTA